VYGKTPPLATALPLYATPTWPVAGDTHEIVSAAGAIATLHALVAVLAPAPFESVTLTEKLPVAVGVPLIWPVAVFSVSPAGSVPTIG
jgi:hypothetical protein